MGLVNRAVPAQELKSETRSWPAASPKRATPERIDQFRLLITRNLHILQSSQGSNPTLTAMVGIRVQ
jgi:hypothetical protein